jgi:NDMA-dependent alcohol dehydrogenase
MKTKAAVLGGVGGSWDVVEVELDEPRQNELTIELAGCGLCHSELHMVDGDYPVDHYPICGGHEGAGVVVAVGANTPGWKVGDRAAISCLPSCGRCRFCATGAGHLCELSAHLLTGARFDDPTSFRMHLGDEDVAQLCSVSCFAEYTTINITQAVKVDESVPLETICVLGCAAYTGWGSAVNLARIAPGDTVIVMGVGGVGSFAVQGALHAGATNVIACDPQPFKTESAAAVGATHGAASMAEATALARELTGGLGADSTIITVGRLRGEMVGEALASVRKAGTVVNAALSGADEVGVPISMYELTMMEKHLVGSMFGAMPPFRGIPLFLDMYRHGKLKLDELVSQTYSLEEVNVGYEDLVAGKNIRGVLSFA